MEKREGPEPFGRRRSVSYLWAEAASQDRSASCFKFGGDMNGGRWSGVAQQPCIQDVLGSALNQQGPQFAPNPGRLTANST